ncbi:hypothetical protein [Christiangramia sp. LLG6405-1]|uniref:hypothetical protein n=1 Tax=Christiangramia sp. LLG6405-1 TaxID=3160832 RepID=UPI0038645D89
MKWIFSYILIALLNCVAYAQTPENFSYQGIIRDNSNIPVGDREVNVKILIKQGSSNGSSVYEELHSTQTNANGLISLQIGSGNKIQGDFSKIDWAHGPFFIESQTDPTGGSNYSLSGISPMLSVPYALHAKSAQEFNGTIQAAQIENISAYINGENSVFDGWDKNSNDDFSGNYEDLTNKPAMYSREEIDQLFTDINIQENTSQSLNLEGNQLLISGGNEVVFENWDMNAADDFSGDYQDLQNKPDLFTGNYEDLTNQPEIYTQVEVNELIANIGDQNGISQSLNLEGNQLLISGGNEVIFENWDMNAADDFSGDYQDLINQPEIYTQVEVNELIANIGDQNGISQSLNLEGNQLLISGGNEVTFENWDMNAADDFSGDYQDLINQPEIYTQVEVNELIANIGDQNGISQSLNLEGNQLLISGGNEVTFENWDMNAADDFSGDYQDLINQPEIYTQVEVNELIANIGDQNGISQSLNLKGNQLLISGGNEVTFENWDMNAADDFSGDYQDLQNKPDLFTGNYEDLINQPEVYTQVEVNELIANIGDQNGISQSLNLEGNQLLISGGNEVIFENWDMNATDDFSGDYQDLQNKPDLFTGNYEDLINQPEILTVTEVKNLIADTENNGEQFQQLSLDGNKVSISEGNSISFVNWDMNADDDFSGDYTDLKNKPDLFNGDYQELENLPDLYSRKEVDDLVANLENNDGKPQSLTLENNKLSIENGNSIVFEGWDTNASDDFDGNYSSLKDAPKIYTQAEVDKIKEEILKEAAERYSKKAQVISLTSSRSINTEDIGNTIACSKSATLTIPSGFSAMKVGETLNLEVHGVLLVIKGSSGVSINGQTGKDISKGNNKIYTGGIIRKTGSNSYIIL